MAGDSRLLYSPQQMAACVAAITATECMDLDVAGEETFQRACNLVFDGRIALGSPCAVPSDCQGPAICSGVCERRAQEGEACANVGATSRCTATRLTSAAHLRYGGVHPQQRIARARLRCIRCVPRDRSSVTGS